MAFALFFGRLGAPLWHNAPVTIRDRLNDFAVDLSLVPDRAGRYSRTLAQKRHRRFLETHWRGILALVAGGLALTSLVLLFPTWTRGFIAGAWIATVGWVIVLVVVQSSGSSPAMMGASAEQWTSQELRWLRRNGWKVASHWNPTFSEVDHIALGPSGLVVIETKWLSGPLEMQGPERIDRDVRQVVEGSRRLRLSIQRRLNGAPVHRAVVYWGSEVGLDVSSSNTYSDVTLLEGGQLRDWLASIAGLPPTLDDQAVQDAWETIEKQLRSTDEREGVVGRKTSLRVLIEAIFGILAGLEAFLFAGVVLHAIGVGGLPLVLIPLGCGVALYWSSPRDSGWSRVGVGRQLAH